MGESSVRYVRSVDRAFDLLEMIVRAGRSMTLGEIVRALELPKSTALNIIRTLVRRGLLEHDEAKAYRPGSGLSDLAGKGSDTVDLARVARPHLEALARATRETVLLAVLDGDATRFIDKIDSSEPIQYVAAVGTRRPLHCTSGGKMSLAMQPVEAWDDYIRRIGLARHTPRTITRPAELRAELRLIRDRGYAVSNGELIPDLLGLSAPVVDGEGGGFLGAIVISGPAFRMRRNLRASVAELLKTAAAVTNAVSLTTAAPALADAAVRPSPENPVRTRLRSSTRKG